MGLSENEGGIEHLLANGWTDAVAAHRASSAATLDDAGDPEAIWGQFNHALG